MTDNNFPPLNTEHQAYAWAQETVRLAQSNFNNILPWRYRRWRRLQRLVRARLAHSRSERARREQGHTAAVTTAGVPR